MKDINSEILIHYYYTRINNVLEKRLRKYDIAEN